MAYRVAAHLKQNRFGVFYFRRVIPRDLKQFFAFKEVSRSTGMSRPGEAAALALRFSATLDVLFGRLRELAKKRDEEFRAELIVGIEWDKDGTLKSLKTDVPPGEEEAASRLVPQLLQVARAGGVGANPNLGDGPKLFAEIEKYLDEQSRGGGWRPQTAMDVRGDFEQFKQVLGDMPVAALNHEALNKLRDALLKLPANINKLPQTRGKSVDEILALGLPPQSPLTVKKKWDRVTAFLTWLEGKGLIERNYARGKKPKAKAQSYEKFTKEDLSRLFESTEYQTVGFKEPFQYWLPVLGLYTGARLEELSQLHLADMRQDADTGIWVIEITEEVDEEEGADTDKNLKNPSSRRKCPIHSAVVAAGLLEYVEDLKKRGFDRLFPELKPDIIGKVSGRASEWFTDYRRSKGVGQLVGKSRKNFHSFRHTMISTLQRAGVQQEIREALCGHASKAINVRVYGDGHAIEHLRESIEMLDYGFTVAAFKPSRGPTSEQC
jgi:integrase